METANNEGREEEKIRIANSKKLTLTITPLNEKLVKYFVLSKYME